MKKHIIHTIQIASFLGALYYALGIIIPWIPFFTSSDGPYPLPGRIGTPAIAITDFTASFWQYGSAIIHSVYTYGWNYAILIDGWAISGWLGEVIINIAPLLCAIVIFLRLFWKPRRHFWSAMLWIVGVVFVFDAFTAIAHEFWLLSFFQAAGNTAATYIRYVPAQVYSPNSMLIAVALIANICMAFNFLLTATLYGYEQLQKRGIHFDANKVKHA